MFGKYEVLGFLYKSFHHSYYNLNLAIDFVYYQVYHKGMKKDKNNPDNDLVTKKYLDERLIKNTRDIIDYVEMRFKSVDEKLEKVDNKLEMLDSILKTLD